MYEVTLYAGSMGPITHSFPSIAKVRSWVEFNNYVLGAPSPNCATYSIEHSDGSSLSPEELESLQPLDSDSLFRKRIADSGNHEFPQMNPLYGAAHREVLSIHGCVPYSADIPFKKS